MVLGARFFWNSGIEVNLANWSYQSSHYSTSQSLEAVCLLHFVEGCSQHVITTFNSHLNPRGNSAQPEKENQKEKQLFYYSLEPHKGGRCGRDVECNTFRAYCHVFLNNNHYF